MDGAEISQSHATDINHDERCRDLRDKPGYRRQFAVIIPGTDNQNDSCGTKK